MVRSRFLRQSVFMLSLVVMVAMVMISAECAEYQPMVGQAGKDVVWVPTCQDLVDKMLALAKVTPEDYLVDLGSGDGRTVITAAKRGTRAVGIEYNPDMVALSKRNAVEAGVTDKAQFIQGDIFETDFSRATVITMFLLPELNLRLRPQLLNFKPGTRLVSNSFTMGEWAPDETAVAESKGDCGDYYTAYLWIVPAKVEGTWKLPQGELTLQQTFQTFAGALKSGRSVFPVKNGRLAGETITFDIRDVHYSGRVSGGALEGTMESRGKTEKWSATRAMPTPAKKAKP